MSIATKTGDDGTTALMYGSPRLQNATPESSACGTVDELNAALGFVRATVSAPAITEAVLAIQKELVTLMGELAVLPEDRERYHKRQLQVCRSSHGRRPHHASSTTWRKPSASRFDGWATPGATLGSSALDLARTACRRAERMVVALRETGAQVNPEILRYLNRLSDLLWLWARWVETQLTDPKTA
ncbi:MAG: cob(I)yrinic acid a,c-diamide adenosyltransferase [Anaeromyxobacter sp.]